LSRGILNGQENHNYEYITKNGYGIKCEDPNKIYDSLNDFINSDKLGNALKNILTCDIKNGAEVIAEYFKENE
jgi:hypothetical protein